MSQFVAHSLPVSQVVAQDPFPYPRSLFAESPIPEVPPDAEALSASASTFQELEDLGTHRRGDLLKGKDSWSEPGGRPFKVRGKTFTMDRRKVSGFALKRVFQGRSMTQRLHPML